MKFLHLAYFFSSIAAVFAGECLQDWNTNQPSSAWNTRLFSYSPNSASAASSSSTLSFMTYNLQSSISNACVSNPQAQASFMTTDYVGNEEVVQGVDTRCNCNMPKIIADTTGKSTRFVMTFPWRTGQYGIGLGTSQTILDTQYLLYTYAGAEQRALVAVKTQPAGLNGHPLWFITTHVDYDVSAARESEVNQLIQWVRTEIIAKDSTAVVVVVGDFNAGPWDPMYNNMKTLFKNSWEIFHGSIADGNTYPSNAPSVRFDHIWYYTPANVQAQVLDVEVVDTQDSDHRPLKASIKFTVAGSAPSTPAPATPAPATPAPATKAPATQAPATPAPATHAPATPAPATPAPSTQAPPKGATSAPVTPAPSSGTCAVSVSYNTAGNNFVIKNTGTKALKTVELTFSPSVPSNNWNLVATSTSNVYTLPSFAYQSLGAGATYSSSGYYTSGTHPTVTATRVSC